MRIVDWWSRISRTGTIGDPMLATAEKGKGWYEATAANLVEFIGEFRNFEIRPSGDLHGDDT